MTLFGCNDRNRAIAAAAERIKAKSFTIDFRCCPTRTTWALQQVVTYMRPRRSRGFFGALHFSTPL